MAFSLVDLIIVLVMSGFIFTGFWFGFIHMTGSFLSILFAALVASRYFGFVAEKLSFLFGGSMNAGLVVGFILLFLIVTRLVGFVFYLINKAFHLFSFVPFIKTANRIIGALLGFAEGAILLALAFYLLVRFPLGSMVTGAIENSFFVEYLLEVANWLAPLLPDLVEKGGALLS